MCSKTCRLWDLGLQDGAWVEAVKLWPVQLGVRPCLCVAEFVSLYVSACVVLSMVECIFLFS